MKKILFILIIALLLLLTACAEKTAKEEVKSIKELYKDAKKVVEEKADVKTLQETTEEKELETMFKETPVNKCALFKEKEGEELCNMQLQASEYKEFDIHTACTQVFRQNHLPYDFMTIKVLGYKTNTEAKKKFLMDLGTYKGEIKQDYLFQRNTPSRVAELVKGKKIIRLTDVKLKCKNFDKLVKLAYGRA